MPLKRCGDGGEGWKWGDKGTCYTGPDAKKKAIKQGVAIEGPEKFKEKAEEIVDKADINCIIDAAWLAGMTLEEMEQLEAALNGEYIYEDVKTGQRFRFRRRGVKKKDGRFLRFVGKA